MNWNNKFIYPKSTRSIVNGSRHYNLDGSNLPSVTTILKATQSEEDKAGIAAWKERVGHKEAERIKNEASSRGTKIHIYLESFLRNKFNLELIEEDNKAKKMAEEIIDNGLKKNLSEIWGAEATVYYPGKYAGTADCIGVYEGKETILDFKQSNKPKKEEYIKDYFLQLGAYSLAHNTVYNSRITQGVILLCTVDRLFQDFKIEGNELINFQNQFLEKVEQFKQNISILESGLMHHYDSTNVFNKNLASIIGPIGLDHLQWIKNKTIDGVIYEKTAKLLNSNIFVNKQENKEITLKIEKALENNQSNKYFFGKDFNILRAENGFIQYEDYKGSITVPEPNVLGDHQLENISTSIAAARKLFNIKDQDIKTGITKIELKGRLQEIKSGKLKDLAGPNRLICDGGHNINAAKAIANWVNQQNQDVHLIVGMMKDKDHRGFIDCFKDKVKSITLIDIPNQEGSISKEELKNKLNGINKKINLCKSIKESIQSINKYQNEICLISGSLYLIGEVLNLN